jgi:hypothetical protein
MIAWAFASASLRDLRGLGLLLVAALPLVSFIKAPTADVES